MGSSAKTPTPNPEADYQQYVTEGSYALKAQEKLLSLQAEAEGRLQPSLTSRQIESLRGQATGMLGLYGYLQPRADQFQQQYAASQLGMMGGLGAQATQAAIGSLDPTTRGIYNTFGQQAFEGLQAGTGLTAQETNQAQQAARAAAQARGLQFSRQGSDLEILNTYSLGQQRQQQRQAVAQAAFQMGAGQQQMGYQGYLTPAFGASQQFGLTGMVNAAQSTYGALGQSSFLTPESQYLANIRANRIQMETAVASANAQRSGAIFGGVASAFGSALGAKIGAG